MSLHAKHRALIFILRKFHLLALATIMAAANTSSARAQSPDFSPQSIPVFVSDFELHSIGPTARRVTPNRAVRASAQAPSPDELKKKNAGEPPLLQDSDIPSIQAQQLTDFFAIALVEALQKGGYDLATRRSLAAKSGVTIRGVFAEPDARNRIRLALLGGNSAGPKFFLYVGIFNLERQDQPLYQLAPVQPSEPKFGPVISLNSYIPLVKYELPKNPTEDDVRKICRQISQSLTALLVNNPAALSH